MLRSTPIVAFLWPTHTMSNSSVSRFGRGGSSVAKRSRTWASFIRSPITFIRFASGGLPRDAYHAGGKVRGGTRPDRHRGPEHRRNPQIPDGGSRDVGIGLG